MPIRNNAMLDRVARKAGLPIPPAGPAPADDIESLRQHFLARRANLSSQPPAEAAAPEPAGFVSHAEPIGFVSQTELAPSNRAQINRRNAQFSTGPTTPEGKAASSRNSLKHGLAGGQLIIPGEDLNDFEALLDTLLNEHQPATATEHLFIKDMAQSHWLTQRAIRLQNDCFTPEGVNEKQLALFLRYQTTHHRAFYKALANLLASKKARLKTAAGFVSQNRIAPQPANGFVSRASAEISVEAPLSSQPIAFPPDGSHASYRHGEVL